MNTSTAPAKKVVRAASKAAPSAAPIVAPPAPAPVAEVPKKATKKAAAPAAVIPVVEAPVPTPSVSRAGSPAKSVEAPKKVSKKAAPAPAVEAPSAPSASVSRAGSPAKSVSAPVPTPAPTTEATEATLVDEVGKLQTQLNTMRDGVATALSQLKRVSRRAQGDIKDAGKRRRKQKADATETAEASATESTEASLTVEITSLQQQLAAMRDGSISALSLLKAVSRRAQQDIKEASKRRRKQKTQDSGAPKKPNNFQIPVPISSELAAFLGCGSTISRTEVNSRMQEFAKSNGLTKGQTIHLTPTDEMKADSSWKFNQTAANSLRKLLNLPDGETLTIFNIQKYLKAHYPKPPAAEKA